MIYCRSPGPQSQFPLQHSPIADLHRTGAVKGLPYYDMFFTDGSYIPTYKARRDTDGGPWLMRRSKRKRECFLRILSWSLDS
jgi:hypothetical protein